MDKCPVCHGDARVTQDGDMFEIHCIHCGTAKECCRFNVTGTADSMLETRDFEARRDALNNAVRFGKGSVTVICSSCF